MKTLRKFIFLGLIASLAMFTACEDDESTDSLNKEDAQQALENNSQNLDQDMQEMTETEGMKAMESLTTITQQYPMPFNLMKSSGETESILYSIKEAVDPHQKKVKRVGAEPFNFDSHTGTYSWNSSTTSWDYSETPGDKIIIEYPAEYPSDVNNATFTITTFSEVELTTDDGTEYAPSAIEANLVVDGTEYMNISYTATFENDEPSTIDAEIMLMPFNYTVSLTNNTISASISKDGTTLLATNLTLTFVSGEMEEIEKIEGNLQVENMNLDGWIKPYALDESQYPNDITDTGDMIDYINNQFDLSLYEFDSGNKIADLKVAETENTEQYPMTVVLEFSDGSTEPAEQYFQGVITYMESLFGNYQVKLTGIN